MTPSQTSSSPSRATLLHETVGTVNVATPCRSSSKDRPKLDRSIDASTLLRVRSGARIDPRLRARFRRWTDPCAAMAEIFELGGPVLPSPGNSSVSGRRSHSAGFRRLGGKPSIADPTDCLRSCSEWDS